MKAKDVAYCAVCVALISVCSWISIPFFVVPFTMQVFAVVFTAYFLGVKRGLTAIVAYIILGLVGVPVFSNFNAGPAAVAGPTGGFIIGFIPFVFIAALFSGRNAKNAVFGVIGGLIGHLVLYFIGVLWYVVNYVIGGGQEFFAILGGFLCAMLPYYFIDLIKIVLAFLAAKYLKKVLRR